MSLWCWCPRILSLVGLPSHFICSSKMFSSTYMLSNNIHLERTPKSCLLVWALCGIPERSPLMCVSLYSLFISNTAYLKWKLIIPVNPSTQPKSEISFWHFLTQSKAAPPLLLLKKENSDSYILIHK